MVQDRTLGIPDGTRFSTNLARIHMSVGAKSPLHSLTPPPRGVLKTNGSSLQFPVELAKLAVTLATDTLS